MRKALWIGPGVGPTLLNMLTQRGGKLLSAQVSQNNLVEGLDALELNMDTLNAANIDVNVLARIPAEQWSRKETLKDVSVGYRNVKYFNVLLRQKALCAEAKKWALENRGKDVTILVYSMHAPFMAAACEVKRIVPEAKICLIVPDLPQYMDLQMSRVKKVLKAMDWRRIQGYMKKVDRYVLYAKPMAEFLGLKDGQWIVMEGSFDSAQLARENLAPEAGKTSVMYSGVLDLRYGIPELLDAMELLDDTYELWLTGDGNAVELIKERAEKDSRIHFYGYLPSRQDLLDKQAQATMLISPRRDVEEASRYCFPSKLFEYMVSGRPVISCLLAGIPEEYHEYIFPLPHATAQEIAQTIQTVADMPETERAAAGQRAKEFVLKEKNKFVQAKKIWEFAEEKR